MNIKIRGQTFELRSERTAFWHEQKTLLAADLHWGKDVVFQQFGIPIPEGTLGVDLRRLSEEIKATSANRLLILGDLVHHKRAVTDDLANTVSSWRARHQALDVSVVLGNHDRGLITPTAWDMRMVPSHLSEGEFIFSHDEIESDSQFIWMGHVHPVVNLRSAVDSLRLPCFVVDKASALLPAFSLFTGGAEVERKQSLSVFAIADSQVLQI